MKKLILLLIPTFCFAKPTSIFISTDHCVAWKARKVMALVKTVEPIGKSCSIQTEMKQNSQGDFSFSGAFPVKSFDSKEEDRDKEVFEILKANDHPNIVFNSDFLSKDSWKKIIKDRGGNISGTLEVSGRKRLVDIQVSLTGDTKDFAIRGKLLTNYSTFAIDPPSVGGGLIAKAKDYLELHFHFQSKNIKNIEPLL